MVENKVNIERLKYICLEGGGCGYSVAPRSGAEQKFIVFIK